MHPKVKNMLVIHFNKVGLLSEISTDKCSGISKMEYKVNGSGNPASDKFTITMHMSIYPFLRGNLYSIIFLFPKLKETLKGKRCFQHLHSSTKNVYTCWRSLFLRGLTSYPSASFSYIQPQYCFIMPRIWWNYIHTLILFMQYVASEKSNYAHTHMMNCYEFTVTLIPLEVKSWQPITIQNSVCSSSLHVVHSFFVLVTWSLL